MKKRIIIEAVLAIIIVGTSILSWLRFHKAKEDFREAYSDVAKRIQVMEVAIHDLQGERILFSFVEDYIRKKNPRLPDWEYSFIAHMVVKYCRQYSVDVSRVLAVFERESNFDNTAVSKVGAMGIGQLMPHTVGFIAAKLGEEYLLETKSPEELVLGNTPQAIERNIHYSIFYLAYLYAWYKDWDQTHAFYGGYGIRQKPSRIDYVRAINRLTKEVTKERERQGAF